jgi:parvulin-like peptidyl-prolyl isomerase
MQRALRDRPVDDALLPRLRYETLRKLVDRELVLLFLEERKLAATPDDVALAQTHLQQELKARGRSLDDYLKETSLDERQLKRSFRWTLSWRCMLDTYMTDQNVEKYFQAHRREFDGTKIRVAHILWKTDKNDNELLEQARKIRQQITGGELTFADAARMHSQAPTAQQGGDVGWIERHTPMPEPFSAAAFELEPEQISEPVVSQFGVHLIQCLEIKPGETGWREVRRELEPAVAQYLFQWAANQKRESAQIEWFDVIKVEKD